MTAGLSTSGTSPSMILRASPSAIAVLPTPGSPTYSGLFFDRRHRICTVRSTSGIRPISGSTLPVRAFSLRSTVNCLRALSFLPSFSVAFSSVPVTSRGSSAVVALADAVADVGHRIEPAHVLLLQEIDRVALALGKQRDQHVGAGDVVAARRLDVQDRALDDALEPAGRGRIGAAVGDQSAKLVVEIVLDAGAQLVAVDAAGGHHLRRMLVVDQRDQQMLEGRIFVAAPAGFAQRVVQGFFEFASETRHLRGTPTRPGARRGSSTMSCAGMVRSRAAPPLIPNLSLEKLFRS